MVETGRDLERMVETGRDWYGLVGTGRVWYYYYYYYYYRWLRLSKTSPNLALYALWYRVSTTVMAA